MLEIYLKVKVNESESNWSMKMTHLNYLDYAQQTPWQLWCLNTLPENTGKKRDFAYVKVPRHVSDELLKLHGLGFKGKMLIIEKERAPANAKNINRVNQNICP